MKRNKLYGLIGHPLSHSFSKRIFDRMFYETSNSYSNYELFDLTDLSELTKLIQVRPELVGFNVTIPYKTIILSLINKISPAASAIGAVNTVKIIRYGDTYELEGTNTDAPAFATTLKEFIPAAINKALILGSGGAAKAVRFVLEEKSIPWKTAIRTPKREGELNLYTITQNQIAEFDLIINCTPVGMYPNIDESPLPYGLVLNRNQKVYDLIYNPEETKLLKDAAALGCSTLNGQRMLELQAHLAYDWWIN